MAAISLKPSYRGVVALIVIAGLLFFGCVMAYMAAAGKLNAAAKELKQKEQEVEAGKQMAQKLEQTKLDYMDTRSQLRYLEASVSKQAYVPTLLKQIEHLGKSVNMKVIGVRPAVVDPEMERRSIKSGKNASEGKVDEASKTKSSSDSKCEKKKEAPYNELNIKLEATGKYMSTLDLIYKLTSFPKIIAVNKVQMSPLVNSVPDFNSSPKLKVELDVTAFVFKERDKPAPFKKAEPAAITGKADSGRGKNEAG